TGLLLALISTGLTIIYGTLGVVNFAHGALFVVGAYAGYTAYGVTESFVIAIVVGALFTLFVGLVIERGLMRLYYGRPPEDQILVTFGIGMILVEIVRSIYGGVSLSMPTPEWGQGIVNLGSLVYPLYRMQALGIAAATLLVLYYVLYRTSL